LIVACLLLLSAPASRAQTPTPDAMAAARSLVNTMKLADQYKALLPAILLSLKPALTQDRPEIERDYETMMPMIAEASRNIRCGRTSRRRTPCPLASRRIVASPGSLPGWLAAAHASGRERLEPAFRVVLDVGTCRSTLEGLQSRHGDAQSFPEALQGDPYT